MNPRHAAGIGGRSKLVIAAPIYWADKLVLSNPIFVAADAAP
jgi:hypothetical protein